MGVIRHPHARKVHMASAAKRVYVRVGVLLHHASDVWPRLFTIRWRVTAPSPMMACRFFAQLWGVDVTPHSHKVSQQRAGSNDCGVQFIAVNNILRSLADFPTCRTQGKSCWHFCSDYFIVPTCWIDLSDPRKFLPKKAPTIETLVYGNCPSSLRCEARPERKNGEERG